MNGNQGGVGLVVKTIGSPSRGLRGHGFNYPWEGFTLLRRVI